MNKKTCTAGSVPFGKTKNMSRVIKSLILTFVSILLPMSLLCRTASADFSDSEIKLIEAMVEYCNEYQKDLAKIVVEFKDKGATRAQALDGEDEEYPYKHIVTEAYNYDVSMDNFSMFFEIIQRDCYAKVIRDFKNGNYPR